ncbi:hypothetical protein [Paenibacillus sp. FSL K6-1230]|uniref:hypothetical protein n=1 Tax=Paenibacillus sp. FSL K6-1230 TaxID=2921603 RepID=UPI0003A4C5DC
MYSSRPADGVDAADACYFLTPSSKSHLTANEVHTAQATCPDRGRFFYFINGKEVEAHDSNYF